MASCDQDTWSWQNPQGNMSACLGSRLVSTSPACNSANSRMFLHEGRMVAIFRGLKAMLGGTWRIWPSPTTMAAAGSLWSEKSKLGRTWLVWCVEIYSHQRVRCASVSRNIHSVKDIWILWADLFTMANPIWRHPGSLRPPTTKKFRTPYYQFWSAKLKNKHAHGVLSAWRCNPSIFQSQMSILAHNIPGLLTKISGALEKTCPPPRMCMRTPQHPRPHSPKNNFICWQWQHFYLVFLDFHREYFCLNLCTKKC